MTNLSITRGKYIVKPTVPSSTETIDYTVTVSGYVNNIYSVASVVVFVGKTMYFGGDYEVDCSDWIESFITRNMYRNGSLVNVTACTVTVDFTFTSDQGLTSTDQETISWTPESIEGLSNPTWDGACGGGRLVLYNSGFAFSTDPYNPVTIKLLTFKNRLTGQTINNIDKTTYMDRYGDTHNASATNKMEIECYVDPDWFHIGEYSGIQYNQLMTAMQTAKKSYLGSPSTSIIYIPGFKGTGAGAYLEGRVKDVEKVEIPYSYNVNRKVPTMKITFEVYR